MISIVTALDALNFLAADVRNLFEPFINVFLVTGQHWTQTEVGLIATGSGLLGIALQTPIGAAIDVTRAKRGVIVATMTAMSVAAIIIVAWPTFWPMALATCVLAVAGDAFVPAVSALTLGLVGREQLARRFGRNSAFDHGGNIAIALVAGGAGYLFSQRAVFLLVPFFAALTSAAVLAIPAGAIDHDRARDLPEDGAADGKAAGYGVLLRSRPLMIFAACAFFFHFANAPLLPLVGQKLALQFPDAATAMLSFCMVAAQAGDAADRADRRLARRPLGQKADLSRRLPGAADPRGALHAVRQRFLASRRATAGRRRRGHLSGADSPRHRRRHARHGAVQSRAGGDRTTQGVGASISALATGEVTDHFGYSASFLFLAGGASIASALFVLFMPETRNGLADVRQPGQAVAGAPGE